MAKLLKLRRGSTSQHGSFTGAEGEVTVDTDKDVLVVHDGSTAGGHPMAAQDMDNVPAGSILGTQLENSGVTAGTYGSSSAIPIVTVDAQGLVTGASTTAIDSTQIANGTSNVSVANNGNITVTRSGTTRLTANSGGVDVTGNLTSTGDLTISSDIPKLFLNDTGNNPDYVVKNQNGNFIIQDTTNSVTRLTINENGHIDINDNLDCLSGVDVTGNISVTGTVDGRDVASDGSKLDGIETGATADQSASEILTLIKTVDGSGSGLDADLLDGITSGSFIRSDVDDTTTGHLNFNRSSDNKFSLSGTNNPFFDLNEGSTQKARFQWSESGYIWIQNHEDNSVLIVRDNLGFSPDAGNTIHTIFHAGNDGSGSGLDADLLDGQHGSYYRNASNINAGTVAAARLDTASTQSAGNNSTKIATTAFVTTAINNAQAFPSGTKMLFQQTSAPTGWTKVTSGVNGRALRVTSGTAGSGGNVGFTSAFADRSLSANAGNATQGGNISVSVGNATQGGNVNISRVSTSGNVNSHTLTTSQIPSHSHSYSSGNPNARFITGGGSDISKGSSGKSTGNTGGGQGHSHGFTGSSHNHNASFSGSAHNHNANASFSGSAHNHNISVGNLDMQVEYLDVIIAAKD